MDQPTYQHGRELSTPGADLSEVTKRHAEEAKLVAKHNEELKAALEKAKTEAAQNARAGASAPTEGSISLAEHEQSLKAATERGRMESLSSSSRRACL